MKLTADTGYSFGEFLWADINGKDAEIIWNTGTELTLFFEFDTTFAWEMDDGIFTHTDSNTTYNSESHAVTVEYKDPAMNTTTAGEITVYYSGAGSTIYTESEAAPVNAGTYYILVTSSGGNTYAAIEEKKLVGFLKIRPKEIAISAGTPSRKLIPFDSADTEYGTTADIIISAGFEGSDTVTVDLASNSFGIDRTAGDTTIGASGAAWTIEYNGTTEVSTPALTISLTIDGLSENYVLTNNPSVSVTVYDGGSSYSGAGNDRRIPITKANIRVFNMYTSDAATRAEGLKRHFKLTQNIAAADLRTDLDPLNNWIVVGPNYYTSFTGSFDGQGHTITGLKIDATALEYIHYQGMFGVIGTGKNNIALSPAMVQNVGLIDCSISGKICVGGVVALNYGGTVQNCYFSGSVSGTEEIGGVVGQNTGMVRNCYSAGYVKGGEAAGGVVGWNNINSKIQNCYSTASVSGTISIGGVLGLNRLSTIQNCYATGSVRGVYSVGGVVGWNDAGSYNPDPASTKTLNCVALNPSVRMSYNTDSYIIGRVVGPNNATIACLYGRDSMTVQYNWDGSTGSDITLIKGKDNVDGADITETEWNDATWWKTLGNWNGSTWNPNIWDIADGRLPILKDMPEGLQNPVIQD